MYETLLTSLDDDGLITITFNRPNKCNAISRQMYSEITRALNEADADDRVKVAVLTGSGSYYCSGNDLTSFQGERNSYTQLETTGRNLMHFTAAFVDFSKPLIAVLNGPAIGIAVTTLALCDAVYAVHTATLHAPLVELGQCAEAASSVQFARVMGQTRANEVLLFGRKLTAGEACSWGLVTQVFPAASFKRDVATRLQQIVKLPRLSLQYSKQLLRGPNQDALHAASRREVERLKERWPSQECRQAISDFFAKKAAKL